MAGSPGRTTTPKVGGDRSVAPQVLQGSESRHMYPSCMPLRKRLQKFGNGLAILLSREMLDQLGLGEGDSVVLEVVSDVLVVRKDGVGAPTALQLLSSLYASEAVVFPVGDPVGEGKQRVALALRAWGPLTANELAERVGIRADYASKVLAQAARDGWVVKRAGRYELA